MDTVEAISATQFRQLLSQQTRLREIAERQARGAREEVLRIALELCPEAVDRVRRERVAGLEGWALSQIADLIVDEVKGRLNDRELARRVGGDTTLLQQARERLAELQGQLEAGARRAEEFQQGWKGAQAQNRKLQEELRAARGQSQVLQRSLSDTEKRLQVALTQIEQLKAQVLALREGQRDPPPVDTNEPEPLPQVRLQPPPSSAEPEWMQAWRAHQNFERTAKLILALGESGECRRPQLARTVAAMLEFSHRDNRVKRTFSYAREAELIEIIKFKQIISGGSPHFVKLTERGREAYRHLTGREAVPSVHDRLQPRHKTDAHIYLNLEAADLLAAAGYQPDLYPFQEERVSGGKFRPDLRATTSDGDVLFVEVERDPAKYGRANAQRMRKWDIYYEASYGHFVVITSDRRAMNNLRSEITYWQRTRRRPLRLWITNVSETRAGKRGPEGSIWLVKDRLK